MNKLLTILLFLPFAVSVGWSGRVLAQDPFGVFFKGETKDEAAEKKVDPASEIPEKKAENLQQLDAERKSLAEDERLAVGTAGTQLEKRLELREELNRYYEDILESLQTQAELVAGLQKIEETKENWKNRKSGDTKASFFQLDDLAGERLLEIGRITNVDRNIASNQTSLEEARSQFEERESERRLAKERFSLNKDPAQAESLKLVLDIAELQSRVEEAKILYLQNQLKAFRQEKQNAELKRDLLGERVQWLQQNVKFTEVDLQDKLSQLEEERKKLNKALESLRVQLDAVKKTSSAETLPSDPELREGTTLPLQFDVRKLAKQNLQTTIQVISFRLQRLDELEELWRQRFEAFNGKADSAKLTTYAEHARNNLEQIQRGESQVYVKLSDLRKNLNNIQERMQNLPGSDEASRKLLYAQKDLTQKIQLGLQDSLVYLYRDKQLYEKFLGEIEPKISKRSFKDRMGVVWQQVQKVWNFELTSIDDKPITVKKLVLALILLLFGLKFAKRLSYLLGRKLFPRLGFDTGVAAGLQTLAFYLILFLVTIIVLYFVNVPLTLFTVLGGALAIGVGFGSQNIVKNFISGLILLMERPIRVGDMVQIDDLAGIVEKIGARSTVLRSFNNQNMLIPNSDFLEKKVVNWTLSDDLARINVGVGVTYKNSPREVSDLMLKAVADQGQVLKTPEPIVLFSEFGESALQFDVYFWIRMASLMDRKRVESDIRFRIEALFREAGIDFAFPQRDIHLEVGGPLEVSILEKKPEKSPSP